MMKTTHRFYLTARKGYDGTTLFDICSTDMSAYGYVTVKTLDVDVEIEIPEGFDIRSHLIALLEEKRQKVMADHQRLMNALDGEIQQLLAIEHKEEA